MFSSNHFPTAIIASAVFLTFSTCPAHELEIVEVEGQPLGANVLRVVEALDYLGAPLPEEIADALRDAAKERDGEALQKILDRRVLFEVKMNPEVRVKVARGPGEATIQQYGHTPVLVKVINHATVSGHFQINSPQSGPVYAGAAKNSLTRMAQTKMLENQNVEKADRFLDVEMFQSRPMTAGLSGLEVEYAIALISSSEAGKREATIGFNVGPATEDIGFRAEVPVLFEIRPAIPVTLSIREENGEPTTARLTIRGKKEGRIYPPQAKRVAPDLFFQPQIYRSDGDVVLLPPGEMTVEYCRGPEYLFLAKDFVVAATDAEQKLELVPKRWVDPMAYGFYCGDHHIHAGGCAHYTSPTEGIGPDDIFLHVKGEGLNVGSVLTWGYCWDYQRTFFSPMADKRSENLTLLKYDIEVSGFGSAAMGHVCLLDLKEQTYPGTKGTMDNWPTWTVPVMRWCKEQGGVTGYPHSSLRVDPEASAKETMAALDVNEDGALSEKESASSVLPLPFPEIDTDRSADISSRELVAATESALEKLPNLAIPPMTGGGALEIFVSVPEGVCDFISAMDTPRIGEWNIWYHLLNCGFPLKVSGETDFPCMSSRRVGQGRVYVQLGQLKKLDYAAWCDGIKRGASYVSDGYAHALKFQVNGIAPGEGADVELAKAGRVQIEAAVSFAPEVPKTVAYGMKEPAEGRRMIGDTVVLHGERSRERVQGGTRVVEIVVNGKPVASRNIPANGKTHPIQLEIDVEKSSWVALRQFPQLHTNPVNVIVGGKPIRASRESAVWCAESVKRLQKNRATRRISDAEKSEAEAAYQRAIENYEKRATEAVE